MSHKTDDAVACFNNGFSCSQAIFSTYCKELGLEPKTALKIAGAFGAGMGFIGEACGAVTGAFMVIGLKHGKCEADDNAAKEKTYSLVREFARRFVAIHGSVKCKELLEYDISTPEGLRKAREKGIFSTICPLYVKSAAEILEEIIKNDYQELS